MTANQSSPLSWTHTIKSVGPRGVSADREATPAECEQLKTELDILSVGGFRAIYTLHPQSGGSYVMAGVFTAQVEQACVVSLEPVKQAIKGEIGVRFSPPARLAQAPEGERTVLDEPDVEPLTGDTIDVGRVLYELLSASLDPYPRRGEAEFSWHDPRSGPDDANILHPFAALSKLKTED